MRWGNCLGRSVIRSRPSISFTLVWATARNGVACCAAPARVTTCISTTPKFHHDGPRIPLIAVSPFSTGAPFSTGGLIVFLGTRDPGDGSYDVSGGRKGEFFVQRDDSGRRVLDVRLGADASAYGRAEKAPGTGLARVPVELFEQLSAGARIESVADFQRTQAQEPNSSRVSKTSELEQPAAGLTAPPARSYLRVLLGAAALAALVTVAWLMRRRTRIG